SDNEGIARRRLRPRPPCDPPKSEGAGPPFGPAQPYLPIPARQAPDERTVGCARQPTVPWSSGKSGRGVAQQGPLLLTWQGGGGQGRPPRLLLPPLCLLLPHLRLLLPWCLLLPPRHPQLNELGAIRSSRRSMRKRTFWTGSMTRTPRGEKGWDT